MRIGKSPMGVVSGLSLGMMLSLAASVQAEEFCLDSAECKIGEFCDFSTGLSCVDSECAGIEENCLCDSPDPGLCSPVACEQDADCPSEMQCVDSVVSDCGAPPSCDGEDCSSDGISGCEEIPRHRECVFQWDRECESDAQCGSGFQCKMTEMCACSQDAVSTSAGIGAASASTEPSSAAAALGFPELPAPPPGASNCECEMVGQCEAEEVFCNSQDAVCTDGWTCVATEAPECLDGQASSVDPADLERSAKTAEIGELIQCADVIIAGTCEPPRSGWYNRLHGIDEPGETDNGIAPSPEPDPKAMTVVSAERDFQTKSDDTPDDFGPHGDGCSAASVGGESSSHRGGAAWGLLAMLGLTLAAARRNASR